jgi:hypothetical protein
MVFQCLQLHKLTYNCKKIAKQKFGGFVVVEQKISNCNQINKNDDEDFSPSFVEGTIVSKMIT